MLAQARPLNRTTTRPALRSTPRTSPRQRRALHVFAAAIIACAGLAAAPSPTFAQAPAAEKNAADNLPITRITLYRSGVASMQRRGLVDGDAKVQLRFTTDQVNDILKSMVVLDLSKGQGQVDGISYGSREPLSKRLSSFGIDLSDQPSMATLLIRLRGAPIRVTIDAETVTGTILGGEMRQEIVADAQEPINVPYINIVTDSGIRSVNLNKARNIEILDKDLAAELAKALQALAEHRADRTKTVDVNLSGEGAREVIIAYVQEAPVWKASYRLVLPDAPKAAASAPKETKVAPETATMQGWAIVENTTDEDWQNVRLSLVSGRPVSFTMDLYEPLFMPRPSVPVPTIPGVLSRAYEGGESMAKSDAQVGPTGGSRGRLSSRAAPAPAAAPGTPRNSLELAELVADSSVGFDSETMISYGAAAQARAQSIGEVFQYELERPVTIERQRSAMLPILSSPVESRRVSIFSVSDGSTNPMRGVEITNTSDNQLMPGPISVYDAGSYAGDAQIGHVPAGDTRLLAYAVDLDVTATTKDEAREQFRTLKFVKGVCYMTFEYELTSNYAFVNKDKARARTIIVETPKYDGYELIEPAKPTDVTPSAQRFEITAESGGKAELKIVRRMVSQRTIAVTNLDTDALLSYSRSGKVSKAVMDAFAQVQQRRDVIVRLERDIAGLDQRVADIDRDQSRIRSNMSSLDRQSQLYERYMTQLTNQEEQLDTIRVDLDTKREALRTAREDLDRFVANLNVE
jgi:hypothetical protein